MILGTRGKDQPLINCQLVHVAADNRLWRTRKKESYVGAAGNAGRARLELLQSDL